MQRKNGHQSFSALLCSWIALQSDSAAGISAPEGPYLSSCEEGSQIHIKCKSTFNINVFKQSPEKPGDFASWINCLFWGTGFLLRNVLLFWLFLISWSPGAWSISGLHFGTSDHGWSMTASVKIIKTWKRIGLLQKLKSSMFMVLKTFISWLGEFVADV